MACEIDQNSTNIKLKYNDYVYQQSAKVFYNQGCGVSYYVRAGSKTAPGFKYNCGN